MIMRVFQFKNSVMNMNCYPANGEYCVIGYFDALDTFTDNDLTSKERIELLSDPNISKLSVMEEICDYYTVIGLTDSEDSSFWEDASQPLIFVSCIRGKAPLTDIVLDNNTVTYTTLDSSDLVICHKCSSYQQGQKDLQQIQDQICSSEVLIAFSVVVVKQNILDNIHEGFITEEKISCLEKCFVKDRIASHQFVNLLKKRFGDSAVTSNEIIGTDDMLIRIEKIKITDWLSLYATGGLLTHQYYCNAFYNIQSNVLPGFDSLSKEQYCNPDEKPERSDDQTLVQTYMNHKKDETLTRIIKKVLKLRWAYVKTKDNILVAYLSRMLDRTYPMFENYFLERVNAYQAEKDDEIIQDIDDSIETFWEAEDAILHTTNAADRIVIQTAAIDTGLRYVGLKLCYYYSEMLRELGEIFYPSKSYGFIVSPTVKDTTTAIVLFRTNTNHGKVSSIRISESSIADVWIMNILLLHEFYHICPAELRLRKERAVKLIKILTYDILDSVTKDIEQNEEMLSFMANSINDSCVTKLKNQPDDSRGYYGANILETISETLIEDVASWLNITTDHIMTWFSGDYNRNYDCFVQASNKANDINTQLRDNILGIIACGRIKLICSNYMQVFREAYCDLMGVLTLRIKPETFIESFNYKPFNESLKDDCAQLGLRLFFVLQAITYKLPKDIAAALKENDIDNEDRHRIGSYFFNDWSKWKNNLNSFKEGTIQQELYEIEQLTDNSRRSEDKSGGGPNRLELFKNTAIFNEYIDYFVACRDKFLRFMLSEQVKFDSWNRKYMIQENADTFDVIRAISLRIWETDEYPK